MVIGDGTEVVATLERYSKLITTEKGKQLSLSNVLYAPEFTKKHHQCCASHVEREYRVVQRPLYDNF